MLFRLYFSNGREMSTNTNVVPTQILLDFRCTRTLYDTGHPGTRGHQFIMSASIIIFLSNIIIIFLAIFCKMSHLSMFTEHRYVKCLTQQRKEAQLDMMLDKLRQESSEEALKASLEKILTCLEEVKNG